MSVTLQAAAAATGNGYALDVRGQSAVSLQLSGTFVGTVVFEQTSDGDNWKRLTLTNRATGARSSSATAPGTFVGALSGQRAVRARISAYVSGNITVTGQAGDLSLFELAVAQPLVAVEVTSLVASAALSDDDPADVAVAADSGTSTDAARSDHAHAGLQLADATPHAVTGTGSAGTGTAASRDDHAHAADPLVLGTDPFSFGPYAGTHISAYGGTDDNIAAIVAGSDATGYGAPGVEGWSDYGFGVAGYAKSGNGVYGSANDAVFPGVYGDNQSTGPGLAANSQHGPVALSVGQGIQLTAITAPTGVPDTGHVWIYLDIADGVVKIKEHDTTVHALWSP